MRRIATLLTLIGIALLAAAPAAHAAADALREGIDYTVVKPPRKPSGPGVEVIEFFSYGCPHCNDFEPFVSKWRAGLPKDVHFRRVPISFGRAQWMAFSKLYLALEATGNVGKLDGEVFAAIHQQKLPLKDDKAVLDWAAAKVPDPKKFADMFKSFGIQAGVATSDQLGADFGIGGVPSLAVGGRYLVVGKGAKSYNDLLAIADRLIEMARKDSGK